MSKSKILDLIKNTPVEWRTLGEAFSMRAGQHISASNIAQSPTETQIYPCFGGNGIRGFAQTYSHDGSHLVIGRQGALCGNMQRASGKFYATEHAIVVTAKEGVNIDWAFHMLTLMNLNQYASQSAQPGLAVRTLERLDIPIPSCSVQRDTVRILDAMTTLTNELTSELTSELIMRRKQYNYYLNRLFTFAETDVEHLSLGDKTLGVFVRGSGLQKKDFTPTGIGCIHYGQIYTHYGTHTTTTKSFVSHEFAETARKAASGDLIIATTSENDEDVCKAVAWLGKEEIAVSNDACIYKHHLDPKYVAYFFQSELFQKQKIPYITGTKVRRVNADSLAKILIPLPSPEEQTRIVAILDKFDALTTSIDDDLSHEIELRRKQYEYYRELLLNFPRPEQKSLSS